MTEDSQGTNQPQKQKRKPAKNPAKVVRSKSNHIHLDGVTGVTYFEVISKGEVIRTAIDSRLMMVLNLLTWSAVRAKTGTYFASSLPDIVKGRDPIYLHEWVYHMNQQEPVLGWLPEHIDKGQFKSDQVLYFKFERTRHTGLVVDHRDRDPLNNRASNLRLIPSQLNAINSDRVLKGSSVYPGVSFHKVSGKFRAMTTVSGKQKILGSSAIPEEAAALVLAQLMENFPSLEWDTLAKEFFPGIQVPACTR